MDRFTYFHPVPHLSYVGFDFLVVEEGSDISIHNLVEFIGTKFLSFSGKTFHFRCAPTRYGGFARRFDKTTGIMEDLDLVLVPSGHGRQVYLEHDGEIMIGREIDRESESIIIYDKYINRSHLKFFRRKTMEMLRKLRELIFDISNMSKHEKWHALVLSLIYYVENVISLFSVSCYMHGGMYQLENEELHKVGNFFCEVLEYLLDHLFLAQITREEMVDTFKMYPDFVRQITSKFVFYTRKPDVAQKANRILLQIFDFGNLTYEGECEDDDEDHLHDFLRRAAEKRLAQKNRRHHMIYF